MSKQYKTYKAYCDDLVRGKLELPFESSGSRIQDFYTYFLDTIKDNTIPEVHIENAERRLARERKNMSYV